MAIRTHSRFTDDVYCTPAPTVPEIDVKKIDVLHDEIFSFDPNNILRQGLFSAEELKSRELYEKYPPKFTDKNKRFILELLNQNDQYLPSPDKSILITRWKPFVPYIESDTSLLTDVSFKDNVFDYIPDNDNQTVEWYLNFANGDLFAYYAGHLLAQDELQVLECIELGALREYFIQTTNTVGSRTVSSDAHSNKSVPTPILISNVERVINLDTKEIYGSAFVKATEEQVTQAFKRIEPPQLVNLIAIEAPNYGEGRYTYEQIEYILTTCYTGFKAAQLLASKTHALNKSVSSSNQRRPSGSNMNKFRTIIHTGWWGCGAYGNNRQMMLITQMLGAQWAQIDSIIFHTQNNEHQKDIDQAKNVFENLRNRKNVKEVIQAIVDLNLEWEKSNNT